MPRFTALGLAMFRVLLGLYPRAFRRAFAFDMLQDFEEASQEAWMNDRWRGVMSLWFFTAADVVRSVSIQWLRSGALIFGGLALAIATSCAAAVGSLDLRVRYTMQSGSPERDGVLVLILVATVVVLVAATVIFCSIFLRPVANRHTERRRV